PCRSGCLKAGFVLLVVASNTSRADKNVHGPLVGGHDLFRRVGAGDQSPIRRDKAYLHSRGISAAAVGTTWARAIIFGQQPSSEIITHMKNFLLGLSIATVVICGFLLLERDHPEKGMASQTEGTVDRHSSEMTADRIKTERLSAQSPD